MLRNRIGIVAVTMSAEHAIPVIGTIHTGLRVISIPNCANFRSGHSDTCAIGLSPSVQACMSCRKRVPMITISAPAPVAGSRRRWRWRGMGDLVASAISIAFLGRTDTAERIAAYIESMWRGRKRVDPVPQQQAKHGGCGCKARQQRLNELLPFRDSHAN
jgi:hypothetical protein